MKIKKLREFQLIDSLTKNLSYPREVIKGVGDDCAVLDYKNGVYTLATCDVQIEGVHFLSHYQPYNVGKKAIAVNVSDIASMGGRPMYCLVSLILPQALNQVYVKNVYKGIKAACKEYGVSIIGGNISKGKDFAIDITMLGEVAKEEIIYRSGAKPHDKVLVTGTIGNASLGLAILQNSNIHLSKQQKAQFISKQLSPRPKLKEAYCIAKTQLVTAMIDLSDGLSSDIHHICDESKVGVFLQEDMLPLDPMMRQVAKKMNLDVLTLALSGGEDYELLFTVGPDAVETIQEKAQQIGTQVSVIGEILPKKHKRWIETVDGKRNILLPTGWQHINNI